MEFCHFAMVGTLFCKPDFLKRLESYRVENYPSLWNSQLLCRPNNCQILCVKDVCATEFTTLRCSAEARSVRILDGPRLFSAFCEKSAFSEKAKSFIKCGTFFGLHSLGCPLFSFLEALFYPVFFKIACFESLWSAISFGCVVASCFLGIPCRSSSVHV